MIPPPPNLTIFSCISHAYVVYSLWRHTEMAVKVRVYVNGEVREVEVAGPLSVFPVKSGKKGGRK
jgi:hypothetical protein